MGGKTYRQTNGRMGGWTGRQTGKTDRQIHRILKNTTLHIYTYKYFIQHYTYTHINILYNITQSTVSVIFDWWFSWWSLGTPQIPVPGLFLLA